MHTDSGSPTVINCTFIDNSAELGGSMAHPLATGRIQREKRGAIGGNSGIPIKSCQGKSFALRIVEEYGTTIKSFHVKCGSQDVVSGFV